MDNEQSAPHGQRKRQGSGCFPRYGLLGMLSRTLRSLVARVRRSAYLTPAGLCSYLFIKGLHPALPGWPCPLRALTGIPCPTCFLTRATAAALVGDLGTSLRLHAFGPAVALLLLIWSVVAFRSRSFLPVTIRGRNLAVLALALLGYWLGRLLLHYGLGMAAFPPGPGPELPALP